MRVALLHYLDESPGLRGRDGGAYGSHRACNAAVPAAVTQGFQPAPAALAGNAAVLVMGAGSSAGRRRDALRHGRPEACVTEDAASFAPSATLSVVNPGQLMPARSMFCGFLRLLAAILIRPPRIRTVLFPFPPDSSTHSRVPQKSPAHCYISPPGDEQESPGCRKSPPHGVKTPPL
jgi:hypothetical protein